MRDPKRINPVLNEIGSIWKNYPDMRLGQLIVNALQGTKDLYYVEDEELIASIKKSFSRHTGDSK